jgi:hypothetical protein
VARRLRYHRARGVDARALDGAFIDRTLESEHRAAQVAHRCETSHQRRFSLPRGQYMEVRWIGGREQGHGGRCHERMPVRIDKARHQHAPARRNNADISVNSDWTY